jgi:hypothetical protein
MSSPQGPRLLVPDELKDVLDRSFDDKASVVLAAVGAENRPLASFRSSVKPHGDSGLSFWARHAKGGTMDALRVNPHVSVLLRSPTTPLMQFHGRARIVEDAAATRRIYDAMPEPERRADPEAKGCAVIVDLDRIEGVLRIGPDGPVYLKLP